jgi:hypothetical protein
MKTLLRSGCLLVVFSAVHWPGQAHADTTEQDRATARALFEEGRRLAKAGKYAEACPKFELSQNLDAGIGTLFNLADCFEHIGRTASAWNNFLEVADAAARGSEHVRETLARQRAQQLLPRLSHLTLVLAEDSGVVQIKLDATVLGVGVLGAPIPVDPGTHTVQAVAAGKKDWASTVTVADGASVVVSLPKLADDTEPAPAASKPPTREPATEHAQPPTHPPPAPEAKRSWQRPTGIVASGLGIVGLGVGTFLGLRAQSQWSTAKPQCPSSGCSPGGYDSWSGARDNAAASTVFFVAGGAMLATGVVLWVGAPASSPVQLSLRPGKLTLDAVF